MKLCDNTNLNIYIGTTGQNRMKGRGQKKEASFKQKYNKYHRHVSNYNRAHRPDVPLADPTFEEVKGLPITDVFWDGSGLTHPDEVWATNDDVKTGIQAFLTKRSSVEEMRRMGREVRQLILWALDHQSRVNDTKPEPDGEFLGV